VTAKTELELAALANDPLRFVNLCWPGLRLYDKQREVLLSVRDNIETFVHAANELGKTRIAAIIAIWWFASRTPARVITSSSSETQLRSILWREIRSCIASSALPLPFRVATLTVEKLKCPSSPDTEPLDYVIGHVTNEVENFQGHHLPNDRPRVLAVFDEASGIPDEFFDAADSWAHRKLIIGNPLSTANFFYRLCRGGDVVDPAGESGLLRKVIHIDGRDSPNVRLGMRWKETGKAGSPAALIPGLLTYAEYQRREQLWDDVKRTTRLHGHFYEGDQALLTPSHWLDGAMDPHHWAQLQQSVRVAVAIGVDVAAGGRDNTCWTIVDHQGVLEQLVLDLSNTMEIVGRTIQLIKTNHISPCRVAIDAGGGGKQIGDRLREQGYDVRIVHFGESADAKQAYVNRRAEMYGKLRAVLTPDRADGVFALPPDAWELRQELAVLPLQYDSEGRLCLPPKDRGRSKALGQVSIRELVGRSPDRADSLVLAIWVLSRPDLDHLEGPLICSGEPGDADPFAPEEIHQLPDWLREIVECSRGEQQERHEDEVSDGPWEVAW
jgi:hypothetical protein